MPKFLVAPITSALPAGTTLNSGNSQTITVGAIGTDEVTQDGQGLTEAVVRAYNSPPTGNPQNPIPAAGLIIQIIPRT